MNKDLRASSLYKKRFDGSEEDGDSSFGFLCIWLIVLLLIFGALSFWTSHFGWVTVDGASMKQTLQDGDNLLIEKVTNGEGLKRGDIIVVYVGDYEECRNMSGKYLIKRLIAIEGDKVKCQNEQVSICYAGTEEWVVLNEPYAYYEQASVIADFEEYTVGEGEVFFLGDNRENSCDSRYYEWEEGKSHLKDRLYKATDIVSVVPEWALEHREFFEGIFSFQRGLENFQNKIRDLFI